MFGDVMCLSHLRWGFVYQRPNHLMSRCARERRVFFVEEPVFDEKAPRLDVENVENGLHVVVPHLPPGLSATEIESTQHAMLEGLVASARIVDPLLWFYTPMALGYARGLRRAGVVYDCMDELSQFQRAPEQLVERERELFGIADLVFTGGQSLYESKRGHHPRVHAFPSSVDFDHFAQARMPQREPEDQAGIPHPRLGFFGVVDERMDLELLETVARARPDFQFVVLGPVVKVDPAALPRLPNIHWLGSKPYRELPAYIAGWDVALMPFARNEATRFISPTKTLEYLAAGKPVVSTSIRDVVRPYGESGLVRVADAPPAFIVALDEELAGIGSEASMVRAKARDAVLARTSWDITWRTMSALVTDAMRAREPTAARVRHVVKQLEEEDACSTI